MENNSWIEYKKAINERLRVFAIKILGLSEILSSSVRGKVVNFQVTKSGTSVYANYRAALRSRSKAEYFSKLSIAVEEADETEMWLELLMQSNIVNGVEIEALHLESVEIIKILASMRKRLSI